MSWLHVGPCPIMSMKSWLVTCHVIRPWLIMSHVHGVSCHGHVFPQSLSMSMSIPVTRLDHTLFSGWSSHALRESQLQFNLWAGQVRNALKDWVDASIIVHLISHLLAQTIDLQVPIYFLYACFKKLLCTFLNCKHVLRRYRWMVREWLVRMDTLRLCRETCPIKDSSCSHISVHGDKMCSQPLARCTYISCSDSCQ